MTRSDRGACDDNERTQDPLSSAGNAADVIVDMINLQAKKRRRCNSVITAPTDRGPGFAEKRDVFRELSKGAVFITPGHGARRPGATVVIDFLIINAPRSRRRSRMDRVNSRPRSLFPDKSLIVN